MRLQAIRDALDRGGVTAKAAVELSAQPLKRYEEILRDMAGIATVARAESRARRGLPVDDTPALAAEPLEVVDAELVPEPGKQEPPVSRPSHAVAEPAHPRPSRNLPGDKTAAATGHVAPPPRFGVLTFEEAVARLPAVNRSARARRGKPEVTKAQVPGGYRMPKKRRPAAERRQESGRGRSAPRGSVRITGRIPGPVPGRESAPTWAGEPLQTSGRNSRNRRTS